MPNKKTPKPKKGASPPKSAGKKQKKLKKPSSSNASPVARASVSTPNGYIGRVDISPSSGPGSDLFYWKVSPATVQDAWLSRQFSLYQRWRPHKIRVRLTSGVSAIVSGQLGLVWIPDERDIPPGESLPYLMAQRHKVIGNVRDGLQLALPTDTEFKWLDTDPTQNNGHHGVVIAFVVSPLSGYEGTVSASLTVDLLVQTELARVPPTAVHPSLTANCRYNAVDVGQGYLYATIESHGSLPLAVGKVQSIEPSMAVKQNSGEDLVTQYAVKTTFLSVPHVFLFVTQAQAEAFANDQTFERIKSTGTEVGPHPGEWENTTFTQSEATFRQPFDAPSPGPRVPQVGLAGEGLGSLLSALHDLSDEISRSRSMEGQFEGLGATGPFEGQFEGRLN